MKSVRLFFVATTILSLAFLVSVFVPHGANANPKLLNTEEYPEAFGARCMDVEYKSKAIEGHSAEGATFVTPPNLDGPTNVHIGLYVNEITEVDESTNSFRVQGFLDLIWCDPRLSFDPAEIGADVETFLGNDAIDELDEIW